MSAVIVLLYQCGHLDTSLNNHHFLLRLLRLLSQSSLPVLFVQDAAAAIAIAAKAVRRFLRPSFSDRILIADRGGGYYGKC